MANQHLRFQVETDCFISIHHIGGVNEGNNPFIFFIFINSSHLYNNKTYEAAQEYWKSLTPLTRRNPSLGNYADRYEQLKIHSRFKRKLIIKPTYTLIYTLAPATSYSENIKNNEREKRRVH
jgi:hypothetical protein